MDTGACVRSDVLECDGAAWTSVGAAGAGGEMLGSGCIFKAESAGLADGLGGAVAGGGVRATLGVCV